LGSPTWHNNWVIYDHLEQIVYKKDIEMALQQFANNFRVRSFVCGFLFGVAIMVAAWYLV